MEVVVVDVDDGVVHIAASAKDQEIHVDEDDCSIG